MNIRHAAEYVVREWEESNSRIRLLEEQLKEMERRLANQIEELVVLKIEELVGKNDKATTLTYGGEEDKVEQEPGGMTKTILDTNNEIEPLIANILAQGEITHAS